jgi:hypothetical protein
MAINAPAACYGTQEWQMLLHIIIAYGTGLVGLVTSTHTHPTHPTPPHPAPALP